MTYIEKLVTEKRTNYETVHPARSEFFDYNGCEVDRAFDDVVSFRLHELRKIQRGECLRIFS